MNTANYGEQETVITNRQSNQINTPRETQPTNWQPNQFSSGSSFTAPPAKSNAPVAFVLTSLMLVLFLSLMAVGGWLYLRGVKPDPNGNILLTKKSEYPEMSNTSSKAPANSSKPMPLITPLPNTSSSNANSTTAPVDNEQIKKDVSQKVYSWKAAAESHSLDTYMSNYADPVNYYNKSKSRAGVRDDKQRAFTLYNSINITLSNMSVTPDPTGENATAVFDKSWVFEGEKRSAGKVQTELRFKKINGQWLITGEKDLKLYYKE
jgi:ketosteroid isomerase-like protein